MRSIEFLLFSKEKFLEFSFELVLALESHDLKELTTVMINEFSRLSFRTLPPDYFLSSVPPTPLTQ